MAHEPDEEGVLAGFRKELQRASVRTRNGIKLLAGTEFAPVHPTPSDVIWREGKAEMRHYRRETRLALCATTARTLHRGLGLLGIEVPERM